MCTQIITDSRWLATSVWSIPKGAHCVYTIIYHSGVYLAMGLTTLNEGVLYKDYPRKRGKMSAYHRQAHAGATPGGDQFRGSVN